MDASAMETTIVWFRRDLRVEDNPALLAASRARPRAARLRVVPRGGGPVLPGPGLAVVAQAEPDRTWRTSCAPLGSPLIFRRAPCTLLRAPGPRRPHRRAAPLLQPPLRYARGTPTQRTDHSLALSTGSSERPAPALGDETAGWPSGEAVGPPNPCPPRSSLIQSRSLLCPVVVAPPVAVLAVPVAVLAPPVAVLAVPVAVLAPPVAVLAVPGCRPRVPCAGPQGEGRAGAGGRADALGSARTCLFEPWEIFDSSGCAFTTFDAYWNRCLAMPAARSTPLPRGPRRSSPRRVSIHTPACCPSPVPRPLGAPDAFPLPHSEAPARSLVATAALPLACDL